jgi:hypothetical protein
LQLRPAGGASFTVVAEQTFTTSGTLGFAQYPLATPWSVAAGDLYAHYGQGIPLDIPARNNPGVPDYWPSSHRPGVGETITPGGSDYPLFPGLRDYYLDAHFTTATPEPSGLALAGTAAAACVVFFGLRRWRSAAAAGRVVV